jgi:hypothetical protein
MLFVDAILASVLTRSVPSLPVTLPMTFMVVDPTHSFIHQELDATLWGV